MKADPSRLLMASKVPELSKVAASAVHQMALWLAVGDLIGFAASCVLVCGFDRCCGLSVRLDRCHISCFDRLQRVHVAWAVSCYQSRELCGGQLEAPWDCKGGLQCCM